ncbi:hypothetical protein GGI07_002974 [Coemansia sp. Benny D115]|nr:hypothetical protein GGI07_002974 [Coemansia sp. Benny D115]
MSVKQTTEEVFDPRLDFLLNASRAAFSICPQLSAYLGNQLQISSVDHQTPTSKKAASAVRKHRRPKTANPPGDSGRRVVKIGLGETLFIGKPRPSAEVRVAAWRDQRNSVEYLCNMCQSKIVFPGATSSNLRAAGLDGKEPKQAALSLRALTITPPVHTNTVPVPTKAPISSTAGSSSRNSSSNNSNAAPNPANVTPAVQKTAKQPLVSSKSGAAKAEKPVTPAADVQATKRKRHKSNLLAAVAANKKKAEAKRESEAGSFSLNDFLSSL